MCSSSALDPSQGKTYADPAPAFAQSLYLCGPTAFANSHQPLPSPPSLTRKLCKAILALRPARTWDKDAILETYFNTTSAITHTHTYTASGVYTVSLAVRGDSRDQREQNKAATLQRGRSESRANNP